MALGCAVAVLGTGEAGSRQGRHYFMTQGGRHKQSKNIYLRRKAVFYYLSYHFVGNWHPLRLQAPLQGQFISESSQIERTREGTGDPLLAWIEILFEACRVKR